MFKPGGIFHPYKILIVEDDVATAERIRAILHQDKYNIIGISDEYSGALLLAERHRPDLVLINVALQGKQDGIAAAIEIRQNWQLPVVFLTEDLDEATVSEARSAGPQAFLIKPFREDALRATVKIALDQHSFTRDLFASKQWLTAVLGSLSDAVIAIDPKGLVRCLNAAAEELTLQTPTDVAGKTVDQVCRFFELDGTPVKVNPVLQSLATALPAGKRRLCLQISNGSKVPVEVFAAPVLEDEQVLGSILMMTNITSRMAEERRQDLERDKLDEQARTATEALGQTRVELRALAGNLMTAQEDERRRVARELHDDLGQKAALLGWTADAISQEIPATNEKGRAALERLNAQILQLCDGLRELSHRLHPSIIKDLGLARALDALVEDERDQGREIIFSLRNVPSSLPHEKATALYRIAQEALRNANKHAAGALIELRLSGNDTELELCLKDDGPGFSPAEVRSRGGLGLISMQERARLTGGSMSLKTKPGQGTVISVRMPLGE